MLIRIASTILVDPAGRLLLQFRDGRTTRNPHTWCPPGGRVEDGEEPYQAALRELAEETGLRVTTVDLFWSGVAPVAEPPGASGEFHVYYGPTTATQDEVGCFEGEAMNFVDAALIPTLPIANSYQSVLPRFLASPEYARLVE
jgi:8-oxo-dGTP diphosphatase